MQSLTRCATFCSFFLWLSACDQTVDGVKAWGNNGDGKIPAPTITPEEADAKRVTEGFLKALRDKKAEDLQKLSAPSRAFRHFLPENADVAGKEATIAQNAAQSPDIRLKRLSEASFVTAFPGEAPPTMIAVVAEAQGTLQVLEIGPEQGGNKVVQIGSNAFGDGGGRWVINRCSAFAAPFKVPQKLSPKPTFEACDTALKAFTGGLSAQDATARQLLEEFLTDQPFVEKQKQYVVTIAKERYGKGEDKSSFQFGLAEGVALREKFMLAMSSYCGCLPSEKPTK